MYCWIQFESICRGWVRLRARREAGDQQSPQLLCRVSVSASPARSPVFSHLASSLRGLWTIRAYKAEQKFQELFDAHQDLHSGLSVSGDDFKGWDVLPSES